MTEQESPVNQPLRSQLVSFQQALYINKLFEGLEPSILRELEQELELVTFTSGESVMRQGEESNCLYKVIHGRLRVINESTGQALRELGRGESVGEMGLLTNSERSATVIAVRDTLLAKLSRKGFYHLLEKDPRAFMEQFTAPIIKRLSEHWQDNMPVRHSVSTIALIPVAPDVPLSFFAKRLTESLALLGTTRHLNSKYFLEWLEKEKMPSTYREQEHIKIINWLNEEEADSHYLVYEADMTLSSWTRRCIRQADHILIVGTATSSPRLGEIESALSQNYNTLVLASKSLVLLYEYSTSEPTGTQQWLDMRHVESHYHVRLHCKADFARLARLLTGHGVGLVLSGGGARGLAHLGVIRALQEANIPIDMIGGLRRGALVAAQYAFNWDYERVMEIGKAYSHQKFNDYTLPLISLFTGRSWEKVLMALFGETQIEDLWTSFFCTSANLSLAEIMVHDSGSLWKSVRASISIPALVPPVVHNGYLLIDGGFLNNLPVDIMRQRNNGGPIFAIDVGSGSSNIKPIEASDFFSSSISGWQILGQRLNPASSPTRVPTMSKILSQLALMGRTKAAKSSQMADFYFCPPVEQYSLLELHKFDEIVEIVEIGYRFATAKIAEWQNDGRLEGVKSRE